MKAENAGNIQQGRSFFVTRETVLTFQVEDLSSEL